MIAERKSQSHAELVQAFDEKEQIRKERDRVEKKGKEAPAEGDPAQQCACSSVRHHEKRPRKHTLNFLCHLVNRGAPRFEEVVFVPDVLSRDIGANGMRHYGADSECMCVAGPGGPRQAAGAAAEAAAAAEALRPGAEDVQELREGVRPGRSQSCGGAS